MPIMCPPCGPRSCALGTQPSASQGQGRHLLGASCLCWEGERATNHVLTPGRKRRWHYKALGIPGRPPRLPSEKSEEGRGSAGGRPREAQRVRVRPPGFPWNWVWGFEFQLLLEGHPAGPSLPILQDGASGGAAPALLGAEGQGAGRAAVPGAVRGDAAAAAAPGPPAPARRLLRLRGEGRRRQARLPGEV